LRNSLYNFIKRRVKTLRASRELVVVQALSSLALWLDIFLIFTVPAYLWSISPPSVALLAFCLGAPMLLLGPIVGTLIDRLDVRKTLIFGVSLRIASTAALAYSPSFEIFLVLVILKGMSNLIYFPSITIAIRTLVNREEHKSFFSYTSLLDQVSKITVPLLAGLLTMVLPTKDGFFFSATAVLLTLPFLLSLCAKIDAKPAPASSKILPLYRDLLKGFSIFKSLPFQLRVGFLYSLLTSLALGIYDPHLAAFLAHEGYPPIVFSQIVSATAAGAVCAALLVKLKLKNLEDVLLRSYGLVVFCLALIMTALLVPLDIPNKKLLYPTVWFINGFGYELLIISSNILLQQLCPSETIGRVSTSFRSAQMLCIVIGPAIGTLLITTYGRHAPFTTAALATFFTALTSLAIYHYRYKKVSRVD